ncbi:sigma 54-interacting transcriptional regulator [bacterium]|nr:sigma 54-interacting transcriptional regulator [bacterium]
MTPAAKSGRLEDRKRLRRLYELGVAFSSRTDVTGVVELVVEECRKELDAEGAAVLLVDPVQGDLYFPWVAQENPEVARRLRDVRVPMGRGIAGSVLRGGRALRIDDVESQPDFYRSVDYETSFRTRSMLAAPLLAPSGAIGVVEVVNRRNGPFDDGDLQFLEALSLSIAVAIDNARLYARLREAESALRDEVGVLRRDLAARSRSEDMVGLSTVMEDVFRLMASAASAPVAVLVEGETGTGKELVARGIHRASPRGGGPFVAVNCAALPETLLESELFGHRRGAFTGADRDRRGLFETAGGGTIFLDEVGEMPLSMQAKLLRVLQESEVIPLGDSRPRRVDVRVISATNRDLRVEIAERRFREDLFYRLSTFPIRLPALRERRDDVPLLADHFLSLAAERHRKAIDSIEPDALDALVRHDWPGNARELQNEIERAVALASSGDRIGLGHLSPRVRSAEVARPVRREPEPVAVVELVRQQVATTDLREARDAFEADFIRRELARHGGNVSRTARALGLSRAMLHKKLRAMEDRSVTAAGGSTSRAAAS